MSVNGVSALERGYRRTPQFETLSLLAGALELTADQRREFVAAAARSGTVRGGGSLTVGPWPGMDALTLPMRLTSFIGRDAELEDLRALINEQRMVTLTGAGGIGKTRTALQAAQAFTETTKTPACFVGLAPIGGALLVAHAIAQVLGVQEVPNRPLLDTLSAFLKSRSALLILDNCEHVLEEVALVAEELLRRCPRVRILATSRELLRAAGEHAYRLNSLDTSDAVALFFDRARAVEHRFALTATSVTAIEHICRRLDGVPLAIELAAARINAFSVTDLQARLDDQMRFLSGGERIAESRQQTMRATLDWSYSLLSVSERRLFERLSIFAGGFTLGAATKVYADDSADINVPDLVQSLVDKSLVVVDLEGQAVRYRLLEPFRQHAREKLVQRDDQNEVARHHALAYLDLATRIADAHESEPRSIVGLGFGEDQNLRAALDWSLVNRSDVLLGQRLAAKVAFSTLSLSEKRRWLSLSLDAAHAATPREVFATLKVAEACVTANLFDTKTSLASAEDALENNRHLDALDLARARWARGAALFHLGRQAEAQQTLEDAVDAARRLGGRARHLLAVILKQLASTLEGDLASSRAYIAEALEIHRELGLSDAQPLTALSVSEAKAGDLKMALEHSTEALALAHLSSYERIVALNWRSRYLVELEQWPEAEKSSRELLLLSREQNIGIQVAWTLDLLAAVAVLRPQVMTELSRSSWVRAAAILGFVDARLGALNSFRDFIEQPQYERVIAKLRDELGQDQLSEMMRTGGAITENRAVELAEEL